MSTDMAKFVGRIGVDPSKKRSKLVLPAPQISDAELDEVVKLGIDIQGQDLSGATPSQTPLRDQLSASQTPLRDRLSATPNTSLRNQLSATPSRTPLRDQLGTTPSQTPLRDQLSINPENAMDSFGDGIQQQSELRAHLKAGLGSLPAPRNDFEIVLPENVNNGDALENENVVEDSSEVEERIAQRKKAEGIHVHMYA